MKHILFLFTTILVFASCKKIDSLTQFNVDYTGSLTIQTGTPLNLPFSIMTADMDTEGSFNFSANNTNADKIQEILLKQFHLQITSPNGQEFDFLKNIEIFINADGLDEKLLAYRYNIENSIGDFLALNSTNEDFKEFIKKDTFSLRIKITTDEQLTNDVNMDFYSLYRVNAKVLGI